MNKNKTDLIKDIELENIELLDSVDLNIIKKTVNENLEGLWNKFINGKTGYQKNLQILETTVDKDLNGIQNIFENRLKENPETIRNIIVLSNMESEKEKEIEDIILKNGIKLNTENNLITLQNELQKIGNQNNNETIYTTPEELKEVFNSVDKDEEKEIKDGAKIIDLIKSGKIGEAIKSLFNYIGSILGNGGEIGLKNYKNLNKYITGLKLNSKTSNELGNMIYDMNQKIEQTGDINKKLKFTYILSSIKNKSHEKKIGKEINPYNLLLTELQTHGGQSSGISAGQVLLINKENKKHGNILSKLGDGGLKGDALSDGYKTPFLHSVIVSKIVGDEIYIRHSTMNTQNGIAGVEEIKLSTLLNGYKNADILVMDMPDHNKKRMLQYSEEKINEKYNNKSALSEITGIRNNKKGLNCVELISKGLDDKSIKGTAVPNKLLSSNTLKPTYLTTI